MEYPRVGSVRGGKRRLLLLPWLPSPWVTIACRVIRLNAALCEHQLENQIIWKKESKQADDIHMQLHLCKKKKRGIPIIIHGCKILSSCVDVRIICQLLSVN